MDSHSSHLNAANRSRSSQTPSPSHSASASVSSSLHKRKLAATTAANAAASEDHPPPSASFPPSSTDDLESISAARGADSDSDPDESEDAVVDDDEEDFAPEPDQDSSIRAFTAARLDANGGGSSRNNTKIKTEISTSVKLEAGVSSVSGIVPKEESGKVSTDDVQTCGAYIAREEALRREVCSFYLPVFKRIKLYVLFVKFSTFV